MKKKIGALLLVTAMLLSLLAGCSGADSAASEQAQSTPAESATSEATEAPAVEEAPEAPSVVEESVIEEPVEPEDPMAKYVTPDNIEELIAGRPCLPLPLAEEGTSISFWTGSPSMDAIISGWNDSTANQELERRTGIHADFIEVAPPAQAESLNLMFASGDYPDVINNVLTGIYTVPNMI